MTRYEVGVYDIFRNCIDDIVTENISKAKEFAARYGCGELNWSYFPGTIVRGESGEYMSVDVYQASLHYKGENEYVAW